MPEDYTTEEKEAVYRLGRKYGEEIDSGPMSHRIKREELARRIRDDPNLDYEEPREIAELLNPIFKLFIAEDGYYPIPTSSEEEERRREQAIDELADEFDDI